MIKIISGGQTGADLAALEWAKARGWPTGGWMPQGFRREDGKHPEMEILYGMKQHADWCYQPRTLKNIKIADKTLIFGNVNSSGCKLTITYCKKLGKPFMVFPFSESFHSVLAARIFVQDVSVLNVAGNREHKNPGISSFVKSWLTVIFGEYIP